MNNPIIDLFNSMQDSELITAIAEIKDSEKDGVLCNGVVRNYMRKAAQITGSGQDMNMTIMTILKQAAYRWTPYNINS